MLIASRRTLIAALLAWAAAGCSTVPAQNDRQAFLDDARGSVAWFEARVPGLSNQIRKGGGYVVFPNVGQWGVFLAGGKFGRGAVFAPDGTHAGWSAINTSSLGLQVGAQGFRALFVFQDSATFERFQKNQLTGSATAAAVVGTTGASGTSTFENGVAVYEGSNGGLIVGADVALNYLRYRPLEQME